MRLSTLALASVFFASAVPASAQTTYSRYASQEELADQGRFPGVQPTCIVRVFTEIFFFDDTSDQILRYNPSAAPGSRTAVRVSAADLDAIAGTDVTQCRDSDATPAIIVFALSNAANEDLLISGNPGTGGTLRLLASGPTADGISAIVIASGIAFGRLYIAQSKFFGAPEDGVYTTSASPGSGLPITPVLTNPDLDLVGIDVAPNGDIYATSSENGVGQYVNKIVRIVSPTNGPTLQVVADPFAGPNPIFVNGTDGGLEDLFIAEQGNVARIFVMNNSFGGPQGETIGRFNLDGSNPVVAFTQSALIATPAAMATGTSAFTTAGGNSYMTFDTNAFGQVETIYLASRGTNGGQTAIFARNVTSLSTAGEQGAAAAAGYAIELANPVRGSARVRLVQPAASTVHVSVVDALGREVAVLTEGSRAETSEATFDASALAPGVYHIVFRSNGYATTRSVTVVR